MYQDTNARLRDISCHALRHYFAALMILVSVLVIELRYL
jgi:integrase